MILDGHVHIRGGKEDRAEFLGRLASAGIDGALVIAGVPPTVCNADGADTAAERLDKLFFWTDGHPDLYPFFWIDPIQDSALEQVGMAVERGAMGFKIMCARFYPRDERAMRTVQADTHAAMTIGGDGPGRHTPHTCRSVKNARSRDAPYPGWKFITCKASELKHTWANLLHLCSRHHRRVESGYKLNAKPTQHVGREWSF